MRIEREHARHQAGFAREPDRLREHGLMAAMHAIEITDGDERRLVAVELTCAKDALGAHAAALLRRGATFQCEAW